MIRITRIVGICGTRDTCVNGRLVRGYPDPTPIRNLIRSLPQDHTCMVVSGGASGVDTAAFYIAVSLKMPHATIPYYSDLGRKGGFARNETLVDFVHELYAFWDLRSPGTRHAIQIAKQAGKLRGVYGSTGELVETFDI
jgi:hypothetical protein